MPRLRPESRYLAGAAMLVALAILILAPSRPQPLAKPDPAQRVRSLRAAANLASSPLRFEKNLGQTDAAVQYLSRGRGYTLFLTPEEAVLSLRRQPESVRLSQLRQSTDRQRGSAVLRMRAAGKSRADLRGEDPLASSSHYFQGKEPSGWHAGVPHYRSVRQESVYPGIDLIYYGAQGSLEYDFVVSPGADPSQIELAFEGQNSLVIDDNGDLVLDVASQPVRYERPVIYQGDGAERITIDGRYEQRGEDRVGFVLAANYDRTRPLIIDPVLNYSSFLGEADDEQGFDITVGPDGSAYIVGTTQSSQFPTTAGSAQTSFGDEDDVFVARLNPIGTELMFSTFLGAGGNDRGRGIAVGTDGSIYVVGETGSTEFPITGGAWQEEFGRGGRDGFLAKLSPDGSQLVYSTFLGDTDEDWANDVALDDQGNAYVVGGTKSSNFNITPVAVQPDFGGDTDVFVVKMNPSGSAPVFSTFLGGNAHDEALAVAVDPFSTIYLTGYTTSDSFPVTAGAFQPDRDSDEDAFVVKIFSQGAALAYSSFFGGNDPDFGNDIELDSLGNAYIAGFTGSSDLFRTPPVFQNDYNEGGDAFVIKVVESPRLQVQLRTYLGTSAEDTANGLIVWEDGSVTLAGHTKSDSFPVTDDATQPESGGGDGDAFVTTIDSLFRNLVFSTYVGGDGRDEALGLAGDASGNIYLTGSTNSSNFRTTAGAFQQSKSDGDDVFVVKISESLTVTTVSAASFDPDAPVAPNSIASGFGPDLAPGTEIASVVPLPSELLDVRVNVIDSSGFERSAALFFVSPQQINFLVPEGTAPGTATVEVTRNGSLVARGIVEVSGVAPALFAANANGEGVAAGLLILETADGLRSTQRIFDPDQFPPNVQPIPANIGGSNDQAVLVLFGTGIRGAGGAANVTVTANGVPQQVLYADDQMEFRGLDQINVLLSPTLAGQGPVMFRLTAGGLTSNGVMVQIQ